MKIEFRFKNQKINTQQLVGCFHEVETVLYEVDQHIIESVSKELELSEITKDALSERIRQYHGQRLQFVGIRQGSFVFEAVLAGVAFFVIRNTIQESIKAGWKQSSAHKNLTELFKIIFDRLSCEIVSGFKNLGKRLECDIHIAQGELGDKTEKITVILEAKESNVPTMEQCLEIYQQGEMVLIPKGKFLYGDDKIENEIDYDYYIEVYPVTNQQYKEFIDDTGYRVPDFWSRTFSEGKENHPVVNMSWEDAVAFCKWRSKKEGRDIRLPTEEEREKAARGPDGRKYPWGEEFDPARCNTGESKIDGTTEVDMFPDGKSPYGCYAMAGNIFEWTDSWYDETVTWHGEDEKVLRSGFWLNSGVFCRCAERRGERLLGGNLNIGFRCVST